MKSNIITVIETLKSTHKNYLYNLLDIVTLSFLKYISDNAEKFNLNSDLLNNFDAIAKLYGDEVSSIQLLEMSSYIESKLNIENLGLSSSLAQFISRVSDEKKVNAILKLISSIKFYEKDEDPFFIDEFIEYIAESLDTHYRTSIKNIKDLMIKLSNIENRNSVLDDSCGYGELLISCRNINKKIIAYGMDINPTNVAFATIFQIMLLGSYCKMKINNKFLNNMLTPQIKVDAVISFPPMGLSLSDDELKNISDPDNIIFPDIVSKRADLQHLNIALSQINDDGIVVMQLVLGCLVQTGKVMQLRAKLVENKHIKAVIEIPPKSIFNAGVSSCIIIANKQSNNSEILFVNLNNISEVTVGNKKQMTEITQKGIDYIHNIVETNLEIENISKLVSIKDIAENEFILTPNLYTNTQNLTFNEFVPTDILISNEKKLFNELESLTKTINEELEKI